VNPNGVLGPGEKTKEDWKNRTGGWGNVIRAGTCGFRERLSKVNRGVSNGGERNVHREFAI